MTIGRNCGITKQKSFSRGGDTETGEELYHRAGIYAEFGKIICISCGCLQGNGEDKKLVIKSFFGADEKKLLNDFANMLQAWSNSPDKFLCAHNGKEFDYPYLCRRMVINGIEIPEALKIAGRKPWKCDTLIQWNFGSLAIIRISLR